MILVATTLRTVGLPAWLWFVIAVLAAGAGAYLLLRGRTVQHSVDKERRKWASLRGWQYVDEDSRLLDQWNGGAIAYFGGQSAVDVIAGSTFTSDGRRPVFVFDQETEGQIDTTVAAVRCRRQSPALIELWLPNVPFQRDQMPDLLGPVGQRYAFVSDVNTARAMITRDLVDIADGLGEDVTVVWLETDWVLAAISPDAPPARLERLLRDLGELADLVDPVDQAPNPGRHAEPAQEQEFQPQQQDPQQQPTAIQQPAELDQGAAPQPRTSDDEGNEQSNPGPAAQLGGNS